MLQAAVEGQTAAAAAPSKAAEKRARKRAAAKAAAAAAAAPANPPAPGLPEHAQPGSAAVDAVSDAGAAAVADAAARLQSTSLTSDAAVQPESPPRTTARQDPSATAATQVQQQPHLLSRQQPPLWMLCPITKVRDANLGHVLQG